MLEQDSATPIWSIGYGNQETTWFFDQLAAHQIQFLIDVRTAPFSRFRPLFNRENLVQELESRGVQYLFMGEELGGRPADPDLYREGKVVYRKVRETDLFKAGIQRVQEASRQGFRVCLFCSEEDPMRCHRSKMIGEDLAEAGFSVQHIKPPNSLESQESVILRLTGGQMSLFGEDFTSNRAFLKEDDEGDLEGRPDD